MNIEEARIQVEKEIAEKKERVNTLLDIGNFLDEDGYPTEDALEIIEKWHWDDARGWFKFIEGLWHYRSIAWKESDEPHERDNLKTVHRYNVSTVGWSGNESIIYAMEHNRMMWYLNWVQSRRGGHYIFELKEFDND